MGIEWAPCLGKYRGRPGDETYRARRIPLDIHTVNFLPRCHGYDLARSDTKFGYTCCFKTRRISTGNVIDCDEISHAGIALYEIVCRVLLDKYHSGQTQ